MIEVKDRVPTRPNRIRLTDESTGEIKYFVWERADEPSEVGTPLNKELFDSIGSDIDSLKSIPSNNLVVNGDFQVWQRGTVFDGPSGSYTADRWKAVGQRVWANASGNMTCTELTSGDAIGNMGIVQYVDTDKSRLVGQKVTLSVKASATSNVTAQLCIGYNQINVKSITLTSSSTVYSITATVTEEMFAPNGCLYIQAPMKLSSNVTGATMHIAWVKLEVGDVATPFVPKSYAEELSVCKYYYNKPEHAVCLAPYLAIKYSEDNNLKFYHCFPNTMRVAPTVTIASFQVQHGTSGVATHTISEASNIGKEGCTFHANVVGTLESSPRLWVQYELDSEIY